MDITEMIFEFENEAFVGFQEILLLRFFTARFKVWDGPPGPQHGPMGRKSAYFCEILRKFALKNSEKVYEVEVRFSLEIRKRVWKWFETPRRLYSVEVPRELCGFCVFSRVFNSTLCVSFMRFHAKFEFQKCAGTSSSFRPYRV